MGWISLTHCSGRKSKKENKRLERWAFKGLGRQFRSVCICVLVNGEGEVEGWRLMGFMRLPQLPGQLYKHSKLCWGTVGNKLRPLSYLTYESLPKAALEGKPGVLCKRLLQPGAACWSLLQVSLSPSARTGWLYLKQSSFTCRRQP